MNEFMCFVVLGLCGVVLSNACQSPPNVVSLCATVSALHECSITGKCHVTFIDGTRGDVDLGPAQCDYIYISEGNYVSVWQK